jgi:hypothetical protein
MPETKEPSMPASMLPQLPWYREPWPWLLMIGPAIVVVAGLFTAWLAVSHEDALVADDYYKRGLAINQEIGREARATSLRLNARVLFGEHRVRVFLSGDAPLELTLSLVHPTRAGLDRNVRLRAEGAGWYAAALEAPGSRYHVVLEDSAKTWRLNAESSARNGEVLRIGAAAEGEAVR